MKINKIIILIAGFLIAICTGIIFYIYHLNDPVIILNYSENTEKIFKINMGRSAKQIINDLKNQKLIKSKNYAYFYLRLKKLHLKAGSYILKPNMTTKQILLTLTKGTQALKKITIPEGFTLKKIAKLFERNNLAKYNDFIKLTTDKQFLLKNGINASSAEGFLYPETYFFGEQDSLEMILTMILKTFFEKTKNIENFPIENKEIYKKIILASIIEREYQIQKEAPIIAGVFTNRLKINMGLQSCATVEYIITEIQNKEHPKTLFYSDLEIKNSYNTYKYAGLPPGPICSPGITALTAACNPKKHNFLYFRLVNPETGEHSFSKTLSEHVHAGENILLKNKD